MAVNPIDLQAVFSQMNQVGKQEALNKDSEVIRQDQAALIVSKEGTKDAEEIPETKDLSEGSGKIKDKEKGNNPENNEKDSDKNKKDIKMKKNEGKETDNMKDPDLGQNIDILGWVKYKKNINYNS